MLVRSEIRSDPIRSPIRSEQSDPGFVNGPFLVRKRVNTQPRPQGLLAFQYGGGRRKDPGTQRAKTIADWCILLRVHTCALIGLFIPKQRWLSFEGFVEAEKCFLQCLRPKWWTEFRSDCSENCDCTVGRQRFEDSDI